MYTYGGNPGTVDANALVRGFNIAQALVMHEACLGGESPWKSSHMETLSERSVSLDLGQLTSWYYHWLHERRLYDPA